MKNVLLYLTFGSAGSIGSLIIQFFDFLRLRRFILSNSR